MNFSPSYAWKGPTFPYDAPRRWQAEALPPTVEAVQAGDRGIVRAIMGSGKAAFGAELCRIAVPDIDRETIVVSAPTRRLVDQLAETISYRLGERHVGRYYTSAKEPDAPVVVACLDSLPALARALDVAGKTVALWIADEAHRTENETAATWLDIAQPRSVLGLTATPFTGRGSLSKWDRVIYEYDVDEALADGVVVPFRIEHWEGGEVGFEIACLQLAEKGRELGPGVINAASIQDADAFAELAHEYGLRVDVVHSNRNDSQNENALDALREGEIDAVVHVSMLQEGVDLPWLRWILLRRNTKSRVRFAQEVGRVLRSHPGKEYATVFDPLELFGSYKITLEAVLSGGAADKVANDVDAVDEAADEVFELFEETAELEEVERIILGIDPTESYLRRVVVALDLAGILNQKVAPKRMRAEAPTSKQLDYLKKLRRVLSDRSVVAELPDKHRDLLGFALSQSFRFNKGAVSDLISILVGLRKSRAWPDLAELMT